MKKKKWNNVSTQNNYKSDLFTSLENLHIGGLIRQSKTNKDLAGGRIWIIHSSAHSSPTPLSGLLPVSICLR